MAQRYRSDIDGLRAVAVLGVVLYHAIPGLLPGGYVGVDVFFVISGFLITSIIASESLAGRFSVAGFYERRFRRILPALIFMLTVTSIAALQILPPVDLKQYGKSLIAVAMFASNIMFWREGGYFDRPAHDKPLLHTWSLAVEEQYYILWPLLIAALVLLGRERLLRGFVWLVVVASLAGSELALRSDPTQAFFLFQYRAWELGLGALIAVGAVPPLRSMQEREAAAWAGIALILAPMILYTPETPFPGLTAVPPCLGTALLIHSGQQSATRGGKLLSWRPILFTGLISYGFYLWHWPVLVLAQIWLNRPLDRFEAILAVSAAFVLAAFSLRYVEMPFRQRGRIWFSRRTVLAASAGVLGLIAIAGAAQYGTHGFAAFSSPQEKVAQLAMESVNPFRARCHNNWRTGDLGPIDECSAGAEIGGGYQVLLLGDSHADHLMPGLVHVAREQGFRVRQATISGCSTLTLGDDDIPEGTLPIPEDAHLCVEFYRSALDEAARQGDLRAIVVSSRWSASVEGLAYRAASGATDAEREAFGAAALSRALGLLIAEIRQIVPPGTEIILVGSTPEFDIWPATCFARAYKQGEDGAICATQPARDSRWGTIADWVLKDIDHRHRIELILPRSRFCPGARCRTQADGEILFRDDDHLTNAGAVFVTDEMRPLLAFDKARAWANQAPPIDRPRQP